MDYTYNDSNLAKHGLNRSDAIEILEINNMTTREFDMSLSKRENLRTMFVGFNCAGRLLEIGVELISENQAHVFHGQPISPLYRRLYEDKINNEQKS